MKKFLNFFSHDIFNKIYKKAKKYRKIMKLNVFCCLKGLHAIYHQLLLFFYLIYWVCLGVNKMSTGNKIEVDMKNYP